MAQLVAHMPVAELVSPPKLVAVHQVGATLGLLSSHLQPAGWERAHWHGPELLQGYADDYCEPGLQAHPCAV